MANYANQVKIKINTITTDKIIHHEGDKTKEGFLPPLEKEYVWAAARQLNGNAFKLWLYLLDWYHNGYVFFSPAAIENALGMKKSSVSDSKKELINKGFLIETEGGLVFTPISTLLV